MAASRGALADCIFSFPHFTRWPSCHYNCGIAVSHSTAIQLRRVIAARQGKQKYLTDCANIMLPKQQWQHRAAQAYQKRPVTL